jgi:hypothetical protein
LEWGSVAARGLDEALALLRRIDPKTAELPILDSWRHRAALHLLTGDADGYHVARTLEQRFARGDHATRFILARVLLMTGENAVAADELSRGLWTAAKPDRDALNTRAGVVPGWPP